MTDAFVSVGHNLIPVVLPVKSLDELPRREDQPNQEQKPEEKQQKG